MILHGKLEEIKKAKLKTFIKEYRKKYPGKDFSEIKKLAINRYNRHIDRLFQRAKYAFIAATLTAGLVIGAQALAPKSDSEQPAFSIENLSEDQRALIESLDGNQLKEYINSFNISSHPDSLKSITDSDKTDEITENAQFYLSEFRRFQKGLLPFIISFNEHPEKYTEQQWLDALDASNDLSGRFAKNQIVYLYLKHNQENPDSSIVLIPDPSKVNFFSGDESNDVLAVTEYGPNDELINTRGLYTGHEYFQDNGFDKAIEDFMGNLDYYDDNYPQEPSSNPSKMQETIGRITNLNSVVDAVNKTDIKVTNHWFGLPTTDFFFTDSPQIKEIDYTVFPNLSLAGQEKDDSNNIAFTEEPTTNEPTDNGPTNDTRDDDSSPDIVPDSGPEI